MDVALLGAMLAGATLVRPSLPGIDIAANNLVVPACAAALAWRARAALPTALSTHRRLLSATLALYAWVWISALHGVAPALSARMSAKYGTYAFIFACLLVALHRRRFVRQTLGTAYAALVILATLGVVESWLPGPFELLRGRLAVHPRVASVLVWPNQLGVLTATALGLGAALWGAGQLAPRRFAASLPILIVALALSASRNGWFVCACVLILLVRSRVLRPIESGAIGVMLLLALITFPISTAQLGLQNASYLPLSRYIGLTPPTLEGTTTPLQTIIPRVALWKAALRELARHPISGIGLEVFANTIGPAITGQRGINTHNLVLNVATELGLVGLGLFGAWLIVLWRAGDPHDATTALPLIALALGQLFDCFTYDYAVMTCTALFAACYASWPLAPD